MTTNENPGNLFNYCIYEPPVWFKKTQLIMGIKRFSVPNFVRSAAPDALLTGNPLSVEPVQTNEALFSTVLIGDMQHHIYRAAGATRLDTKDRDVPVKVPIRMRLADFVNNVLKSTMADIKSVPDTLVVLTFDSRTSTLVPRDEVAVHRNAQNRYKTNGINEKDLMATMGFADDTRCAIAEIIESSAEIRLMFYSYLARALLLHGQRLYGANLLVGCADGTWISNNESLDALVAALAGRQLTPIPDSYVIGSDTVDYIEGDIKCPQCIKYLLDIKYIRPDATVCIVDNIDSDMITTVGLLAPSITDRMQLLWRRPAASGEKTRVPLFIDIKRIRERLGGYDGLASAMFVLMLVNGCDYRDNQIDKTEHNPNFNASKCERIITEQRRFSRKPIIYLLNSRDGFIINMHMLSDVLRVVSRHTTTAARVARALNRVCWAFLHYLGCRPPHECLGWPNVTIPVPKYVYSADVAGPTLQDTFCLQVRVLGGSLDVMPLTCSRIEQLVQEKIVSKSLLDSINVPELIDDF